LSKKLHKNIKSEKNCVQIEIKLSNLDFSREKRREKPTEKGKHGKNL